MLYTFAQADYSPQELQQYVQSMHSTDAIILWQDGVLLALKYPEIWRQSQANCYVLQLDIQARQLIEPFSALPEIEMISLEKLVELSEQYFPQLAL